MLADIAYGTEDNRVSGASWIEPFTPSLNQIRNDTSEFAAKMPAVKGCMFGSVESPSSTVNNPSLTGNVTAAVGSEPFALVPSLDHSDAPPGLAIRTNLNCPLPVKLAPPT